MSRCCVLDSDVLIWHLRGNEAVVAHVESLSTRCSMLVPVIARAEVLAGMRPGEERATLRLLDSLETVPVCAAVADRAAAAMREMRSRGITLHLPDALIGAAATERGAELHTCNPRHYPLHQIEVVAVRTSR